jgi:hypothetical protein
MPVPSIASAPIEHHALVGKLALRFVALAGVETHRGHDMWRLGELDVAVLDDLEPVAPWVEEIEKRPGQQLAARRLDKRADLRGIIDHEPEMPAPIPGRSGCSSPLWIRLMNWSPSSMKALPGRFARKPKSKILP